MASRWPSPQARIEQRTLAPESTSTFGRVSGIFQKATAYQPYILASTTLKTTFNAPPTLGRSLVDFATQPLPEHSPHFRPTSNQKKLPGYWFSRNVVRQPDLESWELADDSYDVLMIYFHGGAFIVGHALMYSTWMTNLVLDPSLRIRIFAVEYELADKKRPNTRYPYQHRTLFQAYVHLLAMGVPPEKMVIGGDSSGGFNTLKCFEHIVDENVPRPGGIILNSPLLDVWVPKDKAEEIERLGHGNSLATNAKKDYVGPKFLKNGVEAYGPPEQSAPLTRGGNWYAERLPPTFMAYGTGEVLLDYFIPFRAQLEENGLDLTVYAGEGEAHVFNVLEAKYSRSRETWKASNEALVKWFSRWRKNFD